MACATNNTGVDVYSSRVLTEDGTYTTYQIKEEKIERGFRRTNLTTKETKDYVC